MSFLSGASPAIAPFARELAQVAEILKEQGMSQEMVNMTLAAHAGLSISPVEPKSPVFEWVEEQAEAPAPEAQPRSLDERREAVLQAIEGMDVEDIMNVLAPLLNSLLARCGLGATVRIHDVFTYKG